MNKESEMGIKRYDAVHIRYGNRSIRYEEGCEAEVVTARDYDALRAENAELVAALERLSTPSGLTAYGEALANAIDVLAKHRGEK